MTPPGPENPEHEPVHEGLHRLGAEIERASGDAQTGLPGAPALATGIGIGSARSADEAVRPDSSGPDSSGPGGSGPDGSGPPANPVERGLLDLGKQIDGQGREGRPRRRTADGGGGPAHAASKRRSRTRTAAWIGGTLALVLVLIAGAVAGYGWYLNHEIHRIDLKNLTAAPLKGADAGTQNILMIGSTSRCALKVQNPAYGLCSQGVTGVNSDVVMVLHLNQTTRSLSILSLPRDLFVPNARSGGANKIDAGLFQGPDQLIAAIEEDYGIPIQHFVELNFDSFINIVNALGGIKMYFPEPVYDAYSGLNIQTTGCLALNGTQALQVVRARHLQYKGPGVTSTNPVHWPEETQSDLARIRRDHEFLRVLAAAVKARGLSNPVTDQQLVSGVVGQLTVDSGLSAGAMIGLVLGYHDVNVSSAPQLTLPVDVANFQQGYVYQGSNYGSIEFPSEPQDHAAVDQFLGLPANANTYSGGTLPAPTSVTVSVLNGSGAPNQATDTAQSLQTLGFHIGTIGDSPPVGQEAETVVYYAAKTQADLAAAQAVAASLSGEVIMAMDPTQVKTGSQVTVVTGTDFSVIPPPAATTTVPAGKGTAGQGRAATATPSSSSTTSPTSGNGSSGTSGTSGNTGNSGDTGAFQPATPTVSPLAQWDPRSCTPNGGEGA